MTTELTRSRGIISKDDAPCAFALEGLCDTPGDARCGRCQRYNELLRSARDLYTGTRWFLSPDGMLYGGPKRRIEIP